MTQQLQKNVALNNQVRIKYKYTHRTIKDVSLRTTRLIRQ